MSLNKARRHSGLKKRVKITGKKAKNGGGKIRFANANHSHLLSNKSKKSKKRNAKGVDAPVSRLNSLRKLLGL
ncbi:50S ribosomal protein L35 [Candidatus Gracilibacteria bacterium]|jgi:ribosomal protein L35|nr:50S ribosomal protein L35 [Candidatus Gracilibacteria bacterium]